MKNSTASVQVTDHVVADIHINRSIVDGTAVVLTIRDITGHAMTPQRARNLGRALVRLADRAASASKRSKP